MASSPYDRAALSATDKSSASVLLKLAAWPSIPSVLVETKLSLAKLLAPAESTRVDSAGASNLASDNFVSTRTDGIEGQAASFRSTDAEDLSVADNAALSYGDEAMSIAVWTNHDSVAADQGIVGKWGTSDFEYLLKFDASGGTAKYVFA